MKDENLEYRTVGRVKDAHGLKGELWVVLFASAADWMPNLKSDAEFNLSPSEELEGVELTTYDLKGARAHKNGVILQSPQILDRTAAEALKGKFLAVPESYFVGDDDYYLDEILGFRIFDKPTEESLETEIGTVSGFGDNGIYDLLVVDLVQGVRTGVVAGAKIEIPFVDELVVEVLETERKIVMALPPGLIEVQLGLDKEDSDQIDSDNE